MKHYFSDDEFAEFQNFLMAKPDCGDIIKGSGGLRKIRWKSGGKGKRGGARVIYYFHRQGEQVYFLTVYNKNEASDLSMEEIKILKGILEGIKGEKKKFI